MDIASATAALDINNKLPHHIFIILPGKSRAKRVIRFASLYCLDTLLASVKKEKLVDAADALFQVFHRNADTRGAAGQLMDSIVRNTFTRGGQWTIHEMEKSPRAGIKNQHWKIDPSSTRVDKYLIIGHPNHPLVSISSNPPDENVEYKHFKTFNFPPTNPNTLRTGYYLPTSATQATFDSFYYDANQKKATILQLTVSNMHTVNVKGLEQLQNFGVKSICYIAVTRPQKSFDLPVPQEYSNFVKGMYHLVLDSLHELPQE